MLLKRQIQIAVHLKKNKVLLSTNTEGFSSLRYLYSLLNEFIINVYDVYPGSHMNNHENLTVLFANQGALLLDF